MRLTHEKAIVSVLQPADHQAGADGDSFKMSLHTHATFLLHCATLTGDAVLKVYSGATVGVKTTSLAAKYRLTGADHGAAADADVFGAESSIVAADGLTLTAATYSDRIVAVEVPAELLADDEPWLTLNISAAATAFNASCLAILSGGRYPAQTFDTVTA